MPHQNSLSSLILFALYLVCMPAAGASDSVSRVRQASLPTTPVDTLQQLARDPDVRVRTAVAMNRRTDTATLHSLASDPEQPVRIAVATNISTNEETFLLLARDRDPQVRSVVSRFEYVPVAVLKILATDPRPDIRLEVAHNWNTDRETLEKLSKDSYEEVRNMALRSLAENHR